MAIIGTPITAPTAADILSPAALSVHTATPSAAYTEALWLKKRTTRVKQGASAYLRAVLLDSAGHAIDLTDYGIGVTASASTSSSSSSSEACVTAVAGDTAGTGNVLCRFREAVQLDPTEIVSGAVEVTDAANGVVKATIHSDVLKYAGVYLAEFGIVDASENLLHSNEFYVITESSSWTTVSYQGPPTIDDIRISLRDSDPFENELLDTNAYDLTDIAQALVRSVMFWNECPPHLDTHRYTTITFPFRDIWMLGVQLHLFEAAEEHYRRNKLKFSAGGTSTDDKNRDREYKVAWQERYERFKQLVQQRKVMFNIEGCWGSFGSGYPH